LTCTSCLLPLEVRPGAALFPCRQCGRAFEPGDEGLRELRPQMAEVTTALTVPPYVRYLAVWAFAADPTVTSKWSGSGAPPESVWEQVRRLTEPELPRLFVPSFAMRRVLVQQLGVGLVQAQPELVLRPGLPAEQVFPARPRAVADTGRDDAAAGVDAASAEDEGPGFGTLSPVLFSEVDARTVAHFVYLAIEARGSTELKRIDYKLELGPGELLFLPALYDPHYVRDSNWRFLLREFDSLVA
jgi:hypothetical protein